MNGMIPGYVEEALKEKCVELLKRLLTEPDAGVARVILNGPDGEHICTVFLADKTAAQWIDEMLEDRMSGGGFVETPIQKPS